MFGVVRFRARNALASSAANLRSFCSRSSESECPDLNLGKALDYEIKLTQMPAAPADFPFEDRDHSYYNSRQHKMSRVFDDEAIKVTVGIEDSVVDLDVEVWKKNLGSFKIVATASADQEITIQRVSGWNRGELFSQLYIRPESEIQIALREFLELRGIGKSSCAYLLDYMLWNSKLPCYPISDSCYDAASKKFTQQDVDSLTKLKDVVQDWSS